MKDQIRDQNELLFCDKVKRDTPMREYLGKQNNDSRYRDRKMQGIAQTSGYVLVGIMDVVVSQKGLNYLFRNETTCQRFKRRLPSMKGLVSFWQPTKCPMCYWLRLALAVLLPAPLAVVFVAVALYYGAKRYAA